MDSNAREMLSQRKKRWSKLDVQMSDLASHDRCAVYRCDKDGQPNAKGEYVVYGRAIKTQAEIEQKCRRKGLTRNYI
jgi:hypothetical protein